MYSFALALGELSFLNKYLLKYKWLYLLGFVFIALSNFFAIMIAPLVRNAVDSIALRLNFYLLLSDAQFFHLLKKSGMKMAFFFAFLILAAALLKGIFMYFMRQTIIVASRYIEYDLKNEIYDQYQKLDKAFYDKNYTGDLMNRISEDVSRVRMYLGPAIMYTINLFWLFGLILFLMFSINTQISLLVLIPLPILSVSIYLISDIMNKRSDLIQKKLSQLTSFIQEYLSGIRLVKSYALETVFHQRFKSLSQSYKTDNLSLVKVNALFHPMVMMLVSASIIITVYVGGMAVIEGSFSFGNIAEYIIYVSMLTWPVASLGWVTSLVQRAAASQKRINDFLKIKPHLKENAHVEMTPFQDKIEFRNVNFCYQDKTENALKNISFILQKGKKIGITGITGSGKSTILCLLLRQYENFEGEILIDQNEIRIIENKSFLEKFGYVPQDTFLFSDTIKNNLCFGLDAMEVDHNEMLEMSKICALHQDVKDFPDQYQTEIGERGISLSGGQKQRLTLARALLKKPEVLIIDDGLSAVDTKTEQIVLKNLFTKLPETTIIYVSHRVDCFTHLDNILVLENGVISENGDHHSLMKKKNLYQKLFEMQSDK